MKIILKFLILSVALALTENRFVLCKGNNSNNKKLKVYNFRIKSGIGKWHIDHRYVQFVVITIRSFSSFMTYLRVCNKNNRPGATCGAGTTYPSGAP